MERCRTKGEVMQSRFVVHEHHASRLHFDFRLEMEGVLRSWAVPRGPSMNPADKRLAVRVEDHPLEYGQFEGVIPEGRYGAGEVLIWDRGDCEIEELQEGKISFVLRGEKLRGGFFLTRLSGRKGQRGDPGKEWLLIKKKDEHADPGWKLEICLTPELRARLAERVPPCDTG
jgi:bifunctional non-homologous end joining protein LigD